MCPSRILIAQIFDRCPLDDIEKENGLRKKEKTIENEFLFYFEILKNEILK